jgi:nitronate monooxygenase
MGGLGALMMNGAEIGSWVQRFRELGGGPLQINLWIPDPAPHRDPEAEASVAKFLERWGPNVPPGAADYRQQNFEEQCGALLDARPVAASSIMGLFPKEFVKELKQRGIAWFATVTNVRDAIAAQERGADVIVAQGIEAGGHRGSFDAADIEQSMVGLIALIPRVVDRVSVPVIAAGGIADGRAVAAALTLGASAVQIGTVLLPAEETELAPAWKNALLTLEPEDTMLTRAYSGRWGRSIATDYVRSFNEPGAPQPAPHPVQRGLTSALRADALKRSDINGISVWAGQSSAAVTSRPAGDIVHKLWRDASAILEGE